MDLKNWLPLKTELFHGGQISNKRWDFSHLFIIQKIQIFSYTFCNSVHTSPTPINTLPIWSLSNSTHKFKVLGAQFTRMRTGDFDDFPVGVLVFAHYGCSHAPGGSNYYVMTYSTGYDKFQIAYGYLNNGVFTRAQPMDQSWSNWKQLAYVSQT